MRFRFQHLLRGFALAIGACALPAILGAAGVGDAGNQFAAPVSTIGETAAAVRSAVLAAEADFESIERIYAAFGDGFIWYGSAAAEGRRALAEDALASIGSHGLDGGSLGIPPAAAGSDLHALAMRDVALTKAFLNYASKMRQGSVTAGILGGGWAIPFPSFDAPAALIDAVRTNSMGELINALRPPDSQYGKLLAALHHYRELEKRGGWPSLPESAIDRFDADEPAVPELRRRLAAEDYLPLGAAETPEALRSAVMTFQAVHGLEVDARVGPKTVAELNVPVAQRVAQIAANLERWRLLPRDFGQDRIVVNVAAATLDLIQDGAPMLRMRVIVGASEHPTPSFIGQLSGVTFNPPWRIPASIATREILPILRRDPDYLADNDIVVLDRPDDPFARRIDWRQYGAGKFPFRLQQLPGSKNSLGVVKFEMSNPFNVYLHDTPAKSLFVRANRNLSHGCVRLERPNELAERVMKSLARWDGNAIEEEIRSGRTKTINLSRPLPVYILYLTAFVDDEGRANFRRDIYNRDQAIERALGFGNRPLDKVAMDTYVRIDCG